jgi:hypothetical protein
MKIPLLVLLVNISLAVIFTFGLAGWDDFFFMYPFVAGVGGMVDFLIGSVCIMVNNYPYTKGFYLSAAVLFFSAMAINQFVY